ncbi:glycosyl hydrolase family 8 [Shigella flexneri]
MIDTSDARKITTSEGQSYAVLCPGGETIATFATLLNWTQNNLAEAPARAPAPWPWGKKGDTRWDVLDTNSASDPRRPDRLDAAGSLVGCGKTHDYAATGKALLAKIAEGEVVKVPGIRTHAAARARGFC